jgi:hypothetical protein
MVREPGLPVYLRAPSPALVSVVFIALGCALAYLGGTQGWLLVLVLCFGLAITLLALARMEWAILGLVVMANVDGFLKPFFAERFSLFFKDYFILLATVRWAWGLLLGEERPSLRSLVAVPAVLLTGYVFAELANPNAPSLLASLAGVRAWLVWIPVFFVAYDYMRSRAEIERLWIAATALSGLVAVYGIIQYFIGYEHLYALSDRFRYYGKMGYFAEELGVVTRVAATMVHPGTFGGAMAFMALAALAVAFAARWRSARWLAWVCLPAIIIGLFLSGARSAMVGACVGAALFLLLGRRPVLLLGAGLLVLIGFWQATELTGGGIERRLGTVTWQTVTDRTGYPLTKGFITALNHPFGLGVASGAGVGSFGLAPGSAIGFVENDFGRAMSELGVGALLYFGLLAAAAVAAARAYKDTVENSSVVMSAALIGAMASIVTALATGAALYVAPGAPYFWLALASVLRLPQTEARGERASLPAELDHQADAPAPVTPSPPLTRAPANRRPAT